jgi:hypothetical protein
MDRDRAGCKEERDRLDLAFFGRFRVESYLRRPFCRRCITAQDDLDEIIAAVADVMQKKLYSLQVHRH